MGGASLWGETPAAVGVGCNTLWWKSWDNLHLAGAWVCRGLSITRHGKEQGRGNAGAGVALQLSSAGSDWFKLCCF